MKISLHELRRLIRRVLNENPPGVSVSADPTDVKGFYPDPEERGVDIHGFWYKSPGRPMGQDGDPMRPEDSFEFIGMKLHTDEESSSGEEGYSSEAIPNINTGTEEEHSENTKF